MIILRNQRKERIEFIAVIFVNRMSVNQHFAFIRHEKPAHHFGKCCFTRTIYTDKSDLFACLDLEADMIKNLLFAARIAEAYVTKFDGKRSALRECDSMSAIEFILFIEIFTEIRNAKRTVLHFRPRTQNTHYETGKRAHRRKIQKKLCRVNLTCNCLHNEKSICNTVAHQHNEQGHDRRRERIFFTFFLIFEPLLAKLFHQLLQITRKAEKADIFSVAIIIRYLLGNVSHLFINTVFLITNRPVFSIEPNTHAKIHNTSENQNNKQDGAESSYDRTKERKAQNMHDNIRKIGNEMNTCRMIVLRYAISTLLLRFIIGIKIEKIIFIIKPFVKFRIHFH